MKTEKIAPQADGPNPYDSNAPRPVVSLAKFPGFSLEADLQTFLDRARNEAGALAWASGFPELVLPCLLAEKEAGAREYWRRREEIRARSAQLFSGTLSEILELAA